MPANKLFRKIYVTNAAFAAARIIGGEGFRCIVEGDMAAYLQGAKHVPTHLALVVDVGLTSADKKNWVIVRQSVEHLLIQKDPTHFRVEFQKLQYVDTSGNIPDGKKKYCQVDITVLHHPPSTIDIYARVYHPLYVRNARGISVVTVIKLIADLVRRILEEYDSVHGLGRPPADWPSKTEFSRLEDLVNVMLRAPSIPLHSAYKVEIKPVFQRLLSLFPEHSGWSDLLKLLIHCCEPSLRSATVQLASPPTASSNSNQEEQSWSIARHGNVAIPLPEAHPPASQPSPHPPPSAYHASLPIGSSSARPVSSPLASSSSSAGRVIARHDNVASPLGEGNTHPSGSQHLPHPPPSDAQVLLPIDIVTMVAQEVIGVLDKHGIPCALFGSMACALYGNRRSPNDVDLLTLPPTPVDPEEIKRAIVDSNPDRFKLRAAADPMATFKVLYYQLDKRQNPSHFFRGNKCKIDILVPGIMHLPDLPPARVLRVGDLPVVPFSVLLLHKLQAWGDHSKMQSEPRKFRKRFVDVKDLENLMKLEAHVAPLRSSKPWKDEVLFSKEFQQLSSSRARELCQLFPRFRRGFALLGLSV